MRDRFDFCFLGFYGVKLLLMEIYYRIKCLDDLIEKNFFELLLLIIMFVFLNEV